MTIAPHMTAEAVKTNSLSLITTDLFARLARRTAKDHRIPEKLAEWSEAANGQPLGITTAAHTWLKHRNHAVGKRHR